MSTTYQPTTSDTRKALNRGFTLLELLITLTIIGTLSAIAVPQYQQYRKRAFDTRALSDLRAVALAEEAYFFDNERYLSCENSSCTTLPGIPRLSNGVELKVTVAEDEFIAESRHAQGTGRIFDWNSAQGGLQE